MIPPQTLFRSLSLALGLLALEPAYADWTDALESRIERIDQDTPGKIGVYVKRLDDGKSLKYEADRLWYLGSAVKLPIALAVLQEVEAGTHRLNESLTLQDTDKIDGSGNVVWQKSGTRYTLDQLLKKMLMESDNTAANMLVRAIGEDTVNRRARDYLGSHGFKQITNFTQVRYEVYSELHPNASKLTNIQMVEVAGAPMGAERVAAFRRVLSLDQGELKASSMDDAYNRYYAKDMNAVTLTAYGDMLEKLVRGQVLKQPQHLTALYKNMKYDTYDAYRLEAGLPRTVRFIHKTGTQHERACHAGVINPQDNGRNAIVVVTCAEEMDESKVAAKAFEQVGRAITQTMLGEQTRRK
jgi:beta-lactamase class A